MPDYIAWYNATNTRGKVSQNAALVILDAKNGGLLTSISYPYYDINDAIENYDEVSKRDGKPLVNRALNGLYRPGSTFKPIVAAAGLTEGLITPSYTFFCDGYHYYYYADSAIRPTASVPATRAARIWMPRARCITPATLFSMILAAVWALIPSANMHAISVSV